MTPNITTTMNIFLKLVLNEHIKTSILVQSLVFRLKGIWTQFEFSYQFLYFLCGTGSQMSSAVVTDDAHVCEKINGHG